MLPGNLFLIAFPSWNLARRALAQEFMQFIWFNEMKMFLGYYSKYNSLFFNQCLDFPQAVPMSYASFRNLCLVGGETDEKERYKHGSS
jgi:hypothetical protein